MSYGNLLHGNFSNLKIRRKCNSPCKGLCLCEIILSKFIWNIMVYAWVMQIEQSKRLRRWCGGNFWKKSWYTQIWKWWRIFCNYFLAKRVEPKRLWFLHNDSFMWVQIPALRNTTLPISCCYLLSFMIKMDQ